MDLEQFLKENNIWYNLEEKEETTATADAAAKTGKDLHQLTKTLVVLDKRNKPYVAIIPGDKKLDVKKVRVVLGTGKLRMCPFEKCEEYSGFPAGGTPPIGFKEMKTVVDKQVMEFETIWGGGGTRNALIEVKTKDVVEFNKAVVADIVG